jgi:hypothetical protein
MPNFDGGHYFLTTLIPIKTGEVIDHEGIRSSPVHMVRQALSVLPTARQTEATQDLPDSPFSRNTKTHFARFAVIDDVLYNARNPTNAILDQSDRTIPQEIDQLPCPYVMFVVDFDAASGDESALRAYLSELWDTMEKEWRSILVYCVGFPTNANRSQFVDYMIGCQIETSMPYNDYWVGPPPFKTMSKYLLVGVLGAATVVAAVVVGWLARAAGLSWIATIPLGLLGAVAGFAAGIAIDYALVMATGMKPFPAAPHSDLPSVLKALYLQRQFIKFAIATQGASPADLHKRFGEFVREHQPQSLTAPTQQPGVIS